MRIKTTALIIATLMACTCMGQAGGHVSVGVGIATKNAAVNFNYNHGRAYPYHGWYGGWHGGWYGYGWCGGVRIDRRYDYLYPVVEIPPAPMIIVTTRVDNRYNYLLNKQDPAVAPPVVIVRPPPVDHRYDYRNR